MLLVSIYAPVAGPGYQVERSRYTLTMLQFAHALDTLIPTLLLDDFNGSAHPHRHHLSGTSHSRPSCPLLMQLLGPG